ncbi:type VI secretion system baseplate subunit TssK [Sphingomonas radiodurans]|uniref:type VI secretion system baseplate subunit TssK n=1 Tax=Sphingomonas radiodurans TaxID=2890321 RepID=UPI001E557CEA|nr:type VI secretion system baseplate subunit TssK [Sphingomonas radiodurans]WBH16691.1 type VI secretion system baseplate subunit TssK [Sphingomonas radiodurans]
MTWENKPVWSEGMFLRPQHFQQFDRYVGAKLEGRVKPLVSHGYGLSEVQLGQGQLQTGKLVITRCAGVFEDGTPFRVPEEVVAPLPLEVTRDMRDAVIHLCIPEARAGAAEVALDASARADTRYIAEEFEAPDAVYGSPSRTAINVGRLQLSLRAASEGLEGYTTLPIARVIERRADDSIMLDAGFIPCSLTTASSPVISAFLSELHGMLHQRGEAIAGRLGTPGAKAVADITDFLMLMSVNRAEASIQHLLAMPTIHPADLYGVLSELAAELSTFASSTNRPTQMPLYSHRDQRLCFDAVMDDLRRSLSKVFEQAAVAIPLEKRAYGISVGQIKDHTLFTTAQFVLAVRAAADTEQLRANMPRRTKIGSVEHIRDLVMRQLPGADLHPMPAEPRQIPFRANTVYFAINSRHEQWQTVRTSGAVALHVAGEIPDLELEMWAIRGQQA